MKTLRNILVALVAFVMAAAFAVTGQSAGAATATRVSPVKTVKALSNGQTVQTFKYNNTADGVGDVWFDNDWLATGNRPAVVIAHGGWWHNGTRQGEDAAAQRFLNAGFVVFNIDYRVAAVHQGYAGSGNEGVTLPGTRWPYQRVDVTDAGNWLKTNAAQFGVNPNRIAVYGSSAGGHMAHQAANWAANNGLFRASVSVGGVLQPTRVAQIVMYTTSGGISSTSTYAKSFGYMTSVLGCSYEPTWYDCGNRWTSFKPDAYLSANNPPMYIVKGQNDPVEPTDATVTSFKYWMSNKGQEGVVVVAPNRGHEETTLIGTANSEDIARWNAMITWLRSQTA